MKSTTTIEKVDRVPNKYSLVMTSSEYSSVTFMLIRLQSVFEVRREACVKNGLDTTYLDADIKELNEVRKMYSSKCDDATLIW